MGTSCVAAFVDKSQWQIVDTTLNPTSEEEGRLKHCQLRVFYERVASQDIKTACNMLSTQYKRWCTFRTVKAREGASKELSSLGTCEHSCHLRYSNLIAGCQGDNELSELVEGAENEGGSGKLEIQQLGSFGVIDGNDLQKKITNRCQPVFL